MATLNASRPRDSLKSKVARRSLVTDHSTPSTIESNGHTTNGVDIADEKHESVSFIWFDPQEQSSLTFVGSLRAINDSVQTFTDASACIDIIRSSKEKIFFICSLYHNEFIADVHALSNVEAIFILTPNAENIKGDFPKLFGVFKQQEELFRVLKETLDIFEQVQLEEFAFEKEKNFLYLQLWKEQLITEKVSSNKRAFLETARYYYRGNVKILEVIGELEKSYRPSEALNWCCRVSFPGRFLLHALRSHSKTQLNVCRFLFTDITRFFQQQPKRKSGDQVYRGMKLSSAYLDQLAAHTGQLVCTSGLFPCTKSRTNALALASSPAYRPDLLPVFFKIDCDASSPYTELSQKQSLPVILFDTSIAFRLVYVKRDIMSVIKLKVDGEAGKKVALEYFKEHKDETIQSILDELLKPPKPPTPPPPPPRMPTPKPTTPPVEINIPMEPVITAEESKAQRYAEKGDVDLAIIAYRRIQPVTARILITIGQLCANRKGDYEYALQCFKQALKMQEKSGEDISETLTHLGNAHQSRGEYDLALYYHKKALELHEAIPTTESALIASNLIGIANAHLARSEHSEAIAHAERALALREALVPPNESSIAETFALLGNIYQDFGDNAHALDLCTKALIIYERTIPTDSSILAELLYNLGKIQSRCAALADAQHSLQRSVKIYQKILPKGHSERVFAEDEFRRVVRLRQNNKENSVQQ